MKKSKHPTSNIQHPTSNEAESEGWEFREVVLGEADELIRIFYSSIQTARQNALAEKRPASQPLRYSSITPPQP